MSHLALLLSFFKEYYKAFLSRLLYIFYIFHTAERKYGLQTLFYSFRKEFLRNFKKNTIGETWAFRYNEVVKMGRLTNVLIGNQTGRDKDFE